MRSLFKLSVIVFDISFMIYVTDVDVDMISVAPDGATFSLVSLIMAAKSRLQSPRYFSDKLGAVTVNHE